MVLVPECFSYLGPEKGKVDIAESFAQGGPILERCRRTAREAGVDVVYGGFWEKSDAPGKVHNACVYMSADGTITSVYRKIHLFDVDLPDGTKVLETETVEAALEEEPERAEAEAHLSRCDGCRDFARHHAMFKRELVRSYEPETAPDELRQRIQPSSPPRRSGP